MSDTGAARAWQFLKRNPDYLVKWRNTADAAPAIKAAPFPLRSQTPADLKAAAWGVLAWENPLAVNGPVSPFWAEAPMLEAEAVPPDATPPVPPLMALLRQCGARMSRLRLWPGGALILKIERDDAAMPAGTHSGAACRRGRIRRRCRHRAQAAVRVRPPAPNRGLVARWSWTWALPRWIVSAEPAVRRHGRTDRRPVRARPTVLRPEAAAAH